MRRFLLVVLLAAAGLASPWMPPAAACSCAGDATEWLPQADGAFVGSFVSHDPLPPEADGTFWTGTEVRYRYQVDRVVKGDVTPGPLDLWATIDGASCGLGSPPPGQQVGLLLRRDGDRWTSNLCSLADPDALLLASSAAVVPASSIHPAALEEPPEPGSDRRGGALVAGTALLGAAFVTRSVRARRRAPRPTVL